MQVTILFFAGVAESTGQRSVQLELPEEATVGTLLEILADRFPQSADLIRQSVISINQEYAPTDQRIRPGDEVAVIPPVSGGEEPMVWCTVTEESLSADRLIRQVSNPHAGAVLSFAGTVREFTRGKRTVHLEYEAYVPMAVKKMEQIGAEIRNRWPEARVAMAHRVGKLDIEEISVIVAVATPHRAEAFEAGRYAMERLKEIVPIWKKEIWEDGSEWKGHQKGPWNPLQPTEAAPTASRPNESP